MSGVTSREVGDNEDVGVMPMARRGKRDLSCKLQPKWWRKVGEALSLHCPGASSPVHLCRGAVAAVRALQKREQLPLR